MNAPTSLVQIRIGGQDYPLRSEPQCKTCQSPHRLFIEAELVRGRSYRSIVRSLDAIPEDGEMGHPTRESLANHFKNGHMPAGTAVQRRLIEDRAREVSKSVEDEESTLVDHITLNRMVIHRGFEELQNGKMVLNASDVLAASKFLHQVESEAGGDLDTQAWIEATMVYMEIAQEFIPADKWAAYGARLQSSPILAALVEKQRHTLTGELAAG